MSFLNWNKVELENLDRKTRKLLTMHKALHPRDDVHRLYLSRKEGGKGLMNVKDTVNLAIFNLETYVKNR